MKEKRKRTVYEDPKGEIEYDFREVSREELLERSLKGRTVEKNFAVV